MKWEEVCCHQSIDYEEEIDEWLAVHHFKDKNIIILWGYVEQPALRTSLEHALNVIDDVTVPMIKMDFQYSNQSIQSHLIKPTLKK
ncbi:hypothetical protein [Bacillus atrophaeus]